MDDMIQVYEGGLEDKDEISGLEWDIAVASPIKGKTCLMSTVLYTELFIWM